MDIYIGLIVSIFIVSTVVKQLCADKKKQGKIILIFGMVCIYLLLALKKNTVGVDIKGYQEQYELSRWRAWWDFDSAHFEPGYVLLQKVFSKLGVSFQLYMAILYAVLCLSLYFFIKKYSPNVTLSLLIYICYQFFVFDISGIRQMLAMAICTFSYLLADKKNRRAFFLSLLLIILASTIHQSALVFFVVPVINMFRREEVSLLFNVIIIIGCYFLRSYIWQFINQIIRPMGSDGGVLLGGNFLFLIIVAIFMWYTLYAKNNSLQGLMPATEFVEPRYKDAFYVRIAIISLVANILLSNSTMLRANMYFSLFLIVSLPHMFRYYEKQSRLIISSIITVVLVYLFVSDTLVPNQFNLCPYLFFWQ